MLTFIIEADDLVKFYGEAKEPALDELELRVPEGKIFTLLGRNGAGKTTFLRIASTQLLPTSGTVTVFGLDAINHPKDIRRRIAIAPQEAKPLWTLNAYDHVLLSLMMRGQSRAEAVKKAKHVKRIFNGRSMFCKYVGKGVPSIGVGSKLLFYTSHAPSDIRYFKPR